MATRIAAMLVEVGAGRITVSAACAGLGMSRQTFYKWRRRFDAEGLPGLVERSRRPRSSPTVTNEIEVAWIVKTMAVLADEGWDDGATSIFYRMSRDGLECPSPRTVHRVLVREGLITPQPQKRRRSSYRSFQFPATDDCWQLDAWEFALADSTVVVIFELLDDRSRYLLHTWAADAETTTAAWHGTATAIGRYGQPLMLLSDNSLAFTGRLHQRVVLFEKALARIGIKTINSSPGHPQTCGKDERHHQTSARWLAARPAPHTLEELQALLDQYRVAYNDRPHQSLSGTTPREQRAASRRPDPVPAAVTPVPTMVTMPTANSRGVVGVAGVVVAVGAEYAGRQLICFTTDDNVKIFFGHHLVRELTVDRRRRYQPLQRSRTDPPS